MIKRLIICVCTVLSLSAHASTSQSQNITSELRALKQAAPKVKENVLRLALSAFDRASHQGLVHKPILTVIDYSEASSEERLWVFDLAKVKLLYQTYVAHGRNSGDLYSTRFSNQNRSLESSLGTYVTENTYNGSNGYSLNLKGLEHGYNDQALNRRVVMHGAWYVTEDFIKQHGQAGRSWGCPAVAPTLAKPIINTIKDGSVIFAYYHDQKWLSHSEYANFV